MSSLILIQNRHSAPLNGEKIYITRIYIHNENSWQDAMMHMYSVGRIAQTARMVFI